MQYSMLHLFSQIALRSTDVRFHIAGHPYEVVEGWGTLPDGYTFHQVAGIAADDEDNIYLFMRGDHNVIVLDRDGNFLREWDAKFTQPHGMTIGRDGNLYFADMGDHTVTKYSPDGELLMTLGKKDQPSDTGGEVERFLVVRAAGPFNKPTGIAATESGDIFVSDGYMNARVHKFAADGSYLMAWGAPGKTAPSHFHNPHGIGIDPTGRVIVCDRENHRIQVFDQQGNPLDIWTADFRLPTSVCFGPDDTVLVTELEHRFSILDRNGNLIGRWGGEERREPGQFVAPHCVTVDSRGDIYVGEVLDGRRVQKFARI